MEDKKGLFDKIKSNKLIQKLRSIKNIEIIIAIIVCLLAIGIYFLVGSGTSKKKTSTESSNSVSTDLEQIISQIKGVGNTRVLITYDGEGELVPLENKNKTSQTTQNDKGTTSTEESKSTVVTYGNTALILKKISPQIIGIVVVAEGGGSPEIQLKIIKAVQTATGVTLDKIRVFEMA